MRAAVLEAPLRLVLREVPEPRPDQGEVLIAVELAGVCGSDLALFRGQVPAEYPLILGHEAIGRVVDPGRSSFQRGDRVVIEPNFPCGQCAVCARGQGNVCPAKRSLGRTLPGVFADLVAVPADFAYAVPDEIAPQEAVLIEPLAVAWHAWRIAEAKAGDTVAVIGCGSEGLLLCQVALSQGARVLAADIRAERLAAAQRLGVTATVRIAPDQPNDRLAVESIADRSPTVIFEAAGAAQSVELAIQTVASGGRVVLVGLAGQAVPLIPELFVRRGLTLLGSLIYDHPADFLKAIELVRGGVLAASVVVDRVERLAAIADVFHQAPSSRTGKVLLEVRAAP